MSRLCAKTCTLAPVSAPIRSSVSAALGSRLRVRGRISAFDIVSMRVLINGNADCTIVEDTVLRSAMCGEDYRGLFQICPGHMGVEVIMSLGNLCFTSN